MLYDHVDATTQRVLGMHVTLMMNRGVGMTTADIGIWMGFLRAQKPELCRCDGPDRNRRALSLDFGDDVFQLKGEWQEPDMVVTRLQWMQARDGCPARQRGSSGASSCRPSRPKRCGCAPPSTSMPEHRTSTPGLCSAHTARS